MTEFCFVSEPFKPAKWLHPFRKRDVAEHAGSSEYFFYLSRNALNYGLRPMNLAPGDEVLVPSFICSVASEAIEAAGATPIFFEVNADCSLNLDAVKPQINARTKAVLAVHYFGIPTDLTELQALCRENGLYLIEYCAHSLGGRCPETGTPIGSFGDISIFSWRKFLSISDGASLIVNNPELDGASYPPSAGLGFNLRAAKSMLDQAFKGGWAPNLRRFIEATRELVKPSRKASSPPPDQNGEVIERECFDNAMVDYPISGVSKFLLLRSAIPKISSVRRRNYQYLIDGLSSISGVRPLVPNFPADASPLVLALRIGDLSDAHLEFRKRGVPASDWGTVKPLTFDADVYPVAEELYRNLVFLPVHQDLETEDLDRTLSVATDVAHGA
ncbi:MAG: DegT/DnrJ/EryC1/StrS family aminotransferase [Pseudomonadota bacterium]